MGARKAQALTEREVIAIRDIILNHEYKDPEMKDKLFFFYEIMTKTGIRRSDWRYLAEGWHENKTQTFSAMVQKQSRVKEGQKPVYVDRLYRLPNNVFYALQTGQYDLPVRGVEWVRNRTNQIKKLLEGTDYDRPLMPHDFRKTFIMMLKHRGWDVFTVKSVTKHAAIDSLIKYYDNDDDEIIAAYESLEKNYYDISNPMKLMQELNKEKAKNKVLEVQLKAEMAKNA